MKLHALPALAAIAALGLAPLTAHAQTVTIVDQSQTTSIDGGISGRTNFSQSFTPTLTTLNFVTLGFQSATGASSLGNATGTVDIISGAGPGGTVLATSPITPLAIYDSGTPPDQPTTFLFTTPVVLTPGSPYTFRVNANFNTVAVEFSAQNPYAGGQAYSVNTALTYDDLFFSEGLQVAAAPEPSSGTALSIGILGLGALTLRARRRSVV